MNSKTNDLNNESIHTILVFCLRILLICTLFMPLIVTTSTYFPFVVGKAIFSRILIEFAVILWIPVVILSRDYRPRKSPIFIAFSTYILIATVSSILGVSLNVSFWSTYERMQGLCPIQQRPARPLRPTRTRGVDLLLHPHGGGSHRPVWGQGERLGAASKPQPNTGAGMPVLGYITEHKVPSL